MTDEKLEQMQVLLELSFDEIKNLHNQISSSKSRTLNILFEENFNLSADILIQFNEIVHLYKDIMKSSYDSIFQFTDKQTDAIKSKLATLDNLSSKIGKTDLVNSGILSTQYKISLESIKSTKTAFDASYSVAEINNQVIYFSIYILLGAFYQALTINDYNKSEKLKENLKGEIGNLIETIPIASEIKGIWNITNQTADLFHDLDKEILIDEFIENIGNGLFKIEKQQELLTNVFCYNQSFIERLKKIINDEYILT